MSGALSYFVIPFFRAPCSVVLVLQDISLHLFFYLADWKEIKAAASITCLPPASFLLFRSIPPHVERFKKWHLLLHWSQCSSSSAPLIDQAQLLSTYDVIERFLITANDRCLVFFVALMNRGPRAKPRTKSIRIGPTTLYMIHLSSLCRYPLYLLQSSLYNYVLPVIQRNPWVSGSSVSAYRT